MPNHPDPPPPTAHGLSDRQWREADELHDAGRDAELEWRALVADMPKPDPDDLEMKARDWLRFAGIYDLDDWLLSWRIEHERKHIPSPE